MRSEPEQPTNLKDVEGFINYLVQNVKEDNNVVFPPHVQELLIQVLDRYCYLEENKLNIKYPQSFDIEEELKEGNIINFPGRN
jgi:hypothetical protein